MWQAYYREALTKSDIRCVSASVDPEFFESYATGLPSGLPLRILFVGWIVEAKGITDLLDAAEMLLSRTARPFEVRLVGPPLDGVSRFGRLRDGVSRWRSEIERRGLRDRVVLAGSVNSRTDLRREFRSADVFAFPSHAEGFPVALLEAAAVGLPCVATRVGGVPDVLDQGRAGVLVEPHAPWELAAALHRLLESARDRQTLGAAAKQRARTHYDLRTCAASYLRLAGVE
jgi:glycosyltransferase involved in cell wall biosynthesis